MYIFKSKPEIQPSWQRSVMIPGSLDYLSSLKWCHQFSVFRLVVWKGSLLMLELLN